MSAVEVYRKTRKVPDLFWNLYVCRPVAAVFVDALAGTLVTPNQVTLAALVVAVASAGVLLFVPGYLGIVLGVLVYELSYVLDCVDGMLARWRGTASSVGHLLDFLMDEIKAFGMLAAIATRIYFDRADERFLLLGLFGLVALATGIGLTTFTRRPEVARAASAPAAEQAPAKRAGIVGAIESVAKLLIHYPSYVWLAGLLGHLEWYLFPYVAVNALYAARMLLGVALRYGRFERSAAP